MGPIERLPVAARGVAYMLVSTVLFAVLWVLIRIASQSFEPALVVFYRTLFGLLFMVPLLLRRGRALFATRRIGRHLLRGALGALAMYANFYAVALAPLADVVAISYASPLFAALAAVLFLGEIVRMRRIAALAIGTLGMLVVLRPGFEALDAGRLAALCGAIAVAGSLTMIKLLSRDDRPETIVGYTFLLVLPLNFAVALFFWRWPTPLELMLLAAIGVLANLAHTALARAFAAADVSAVLPIDFVRLLLAAGFGAVLFGEPLEWQTAAGGLLILLSTVYLAQREAGALRRGGAPPDGGAPG